MPHFHRLVLVFFAALVAGSCRPEPGLAPSPTDAQELLLTRRVTARYNVPVTPTTASAVTYQGRNFYPLIRSEEIFQYDDNRRLTLAQQWNPDRPEYSYDWSKCSYRYADNAMIYTNHNVYPLYEQVYPLNNRGYISELNTYDKDDYVTTRHESYGAIITRTIVGGNVVKQVSQEQSGRRTILYEYDLSKPGIPDPQTVSWGRASRNLITKLTSVEESFTGVAPVMPNHHVTVYTYAFDARGVATQQTAYTEDNLMSNPSVIYYSLAISALEYKQ